MRTQRWCTVVENRWYDRDQDQFRNAEILYEHIQDQRTILTADANEVHTLSWRNKGDGGLR